MPESKSRRSTFELDLYEAGLDVSTGDRHATIEVEADGDGQCVRLSHAGETWRYRVDHEGVAERITPAQVVVIPPWVRAALEHVNVDVELEERA
ncbi:hypothetical protein Hbl1158_02785 [Halobaculum sp. CBA1158]|uniref:hypothetical protein n=1 Tax=Halobaculum sp. CBA1158 TaxID=2904243 RepID=UPI001F46D4A1|nr:hypothetical protein [Halobaculum sp. CBA1158]UIP00313.1 hypothetical protein Hbl1158_02785 [Halobaculum sp. CBA1158]